MKKFNLLLFLSPFLAIWGLNAQPSFTNSTNLLSMQNFHSGVAIAVTDMNGDGLDDIARMQEGRELYIEFQQADGSFVNMQIGNMANSSQWSMCAADMDNNGYVDVFSGGAYDGITVARANADGTVYNLEELPDASLFIQGSNFADINNDGWVDIFACHDDAESRIWANDGAGGFNAADNWIDMATTPNSDNSGNYGSVWCDFDYDGDLDLYIAKCRQGVNSPNDPRRINALFVNDGNGNYTEAAEAYGLKIGAQSWTADFADIDNDGDFDCFVTNHDAPSQLLRNDNNMFTDITAESGVDVTVTPIQGIMEDFDNDGFVDILVAGSDEQFFHNNGDGTFTEINGLFDNNDMESFALGDLNHDGFLDIYGGYANIYTSPSNVDDALWLNNANDNNYIGVNLIGVESNRSAIGAKVEIHGAWGIQIREVRAGEGYGIVNSFSQLFGIGSETAIDQLIVKWPSGIIDIIDNPTPNQYLTIIENNCVAPVVDITASDDLVLCPGETLDLSAPAGYTYAWSTGETAQQITVNAPGSYGLTVTDADNCPGATSINIVASPDETPTVSALGELSFCEGGSVTLTSSAADGYEWSTGETTQEITVGTAGSYVVTIPGACEEFTSEAIMVDVLAAPVPTAAGTSISEPQSVTLTATGSDPQWYDMATGGTLLGTGTEYTTPVLSETTTYYVEDLHSYGGGDFNTGIIDHSGPDYSGSQFNGEVIFDALTEFTLASVKVYTDTPGPRTIELRDAGGTVLQSLTVTLNGPEEIVDLNFDILPGTDYVLSTDGTANTANFGDVSPELKRNNEGVNYPYLVPDVVNIKDSNYGAQYYYYFYDWKVELPSTDCNSDRIPVTVEYSTVSVTNIDESSSIKMYPNPTSGRVNFEMDFEEVTDVEVSVFDVTGRNVEQATWGDLGTGAQESLNLSHLPKGIYNIRLTANERVYSAKLIIQ